MVDTWWYNGRFMVKNCETMVGNGGYLCNNGDNMVHQWQKMVYSWWNNVRYKMVATCLTNIRTIAIIE